MITNDYDVKRTEQIGLRSPEIQEIIGKVPSRIIRSGMTVIFLTMVVFLLISHFIHYPDVVETPVLITTDPGPSFLLAKTSGNLVLLKAENEKVNEGDLIAYVKSNADPEAIQLFENNLNNDVDFLETNITRSLGSLEANYSEVMKSSMALKDFKLNARADIEVHQVKNEIATLKKMQAALANELVLVSQELKIAREKFAGDSVRFIQKIISLIDFNTIQNTWLQQQHEARTLEIAIISNEAQLNQLRKQIDNANIQAREQMGKLEMIARDARKNALTEIAKWKESYLFISPVAGRLNYLSFLESGQYIESSKQYFCIVPDVGRILGRGELPANRTSEVQVGQHVNIRLDSYPVEKFGTLEGEVASVFLTPGVNQGRFTIALTSQSITSLNKNIKAHQLTGTAQIITEDLRLWERFFYQLRHIIHTL